MSFKKVPANTRTVTSITSFGQDTSWHEDLISYAVKYKKKVINDHKEFKSIVKSKRANLRNKNEQLAPDKAAV